jgi:hypothetical protein
MALETQEQGGAGAREEQRNTPGPQGPERPVTVPKPPPSPSGRSKVDPAVEGALRAWWRSEFRRGYLNGRGGTP